MRVLVTGAAGYFGRRLLPALAADPRVEALVALDRVPVSHLPPMARAAVRDVAADPCEDLLDQADAVVHLAFRVDRLPGAKAPASQHRFLRAAAARPLRLVVASSVAAYGFADAPEDPLPEDTPRRPARGFYYAEEKQVAEALLDALEPGAAATIVRARPSMVGGPTVDPRRALQYRGRVQLLPAVPHPGWVQVLHEDDLAGAFMTLIDAPAGAYNVAPDDALTAEDAARLVGQRPVTVPLWLAKAACAVAWRAGASSLDPAWVEAARYPTPIADNRKLKALGWAPRRTTRDALLDTVAAWGGQEVRP